ncbi:AraC family transcriptional regulator [Paenibacillus sp. OV219]|uniref:AraC family transcriptional regulator n=1 Tax=Paenibacillus sp. OV219 TaxID=1884377 RepID=UPI0008CB14EE|nr:AraC family transcriptional regulator [Paenibacillus sp. OV219]SEN96253.1 AraC-type DNA-binding protein [Paenibacillus sp. OV219]
MNTILYGESFFRPGELFSIVRHAEVDRDHRYYHSHDFLEICYVYSGSGFHRIGEMEYQVGRGDVFIINDGNKHAFYRGETDDELITYNLLFKPGFIDDRLLPFDDFSSLSLSYLFEGLWEDESQMVGLRLSMGNLNEIDPLLDDMIQEYKNALSGYQAILRSHLIRFIVNIMRVLHLKGEELENPHPRRSLSMIESAVRHLQANYAKSIDIEELARKSFFSKNYFARLFKETTGITVYQYGQQMRIEEASRLIRNTDKSLGEIAREVGYADYKTFFSAFRKLKEVSPQVYRDLNPT